jgi:hypothetical protein
MTTRLLVIVFTAVILAISWSAPTSAQLAQDQVRNANIDRPGSDYANFDIFPAPPFLSAEANCMERCRQDRQCLAWTFVKPGIQGPNARCWLKNAIPLARANNCCVSGVVPKPVEPNTNRPGRDYLSFDLTGSGFADINFCRTSCRNDQRCVGWTYVLRVVGASGGRCWLKNALPAARADGCCVSGISDRPIVIP